MSLMRGRRLGLDRLVDAEVWSRGRSKLYTCPIGLFSKIRNHVEVIQLELPYVYTVTYYNHKSSERTVFF